MPAVRPTLLHRLARIDRRRRNLLLEAARRLTLISAQLHLLPFRRAIRLGLAPVGERDGVSAIECAAAVRTAARWLPWRVVCIHQGLCLQQMLRVRGMDALLHYGARQQEVPARALQAHVWVTLSGEILIGEDETGTFGLLATFP